MTEGGSSGGASGAPPTRASAGRGGASIVVRPSRVEDLPAIRATLEASFEVDAVPGFERSDIERMLTRLAPDPAGTVVAELEGRVVGHCTPRQDDLTVHPDHRRRRVGTALVPAALDLVRARGLPWLQLYVPSHDPGGMAFARSVGLEYHSSLWLMRLPAGTAVPPPAFPPSVIVRAFRPGTDEERYVSLMNRSFADHPTPLGWDLEVVRAVHALPDFDPAGILLLAEPGADGRLVGFARTEVGPSDEGPVVGWIGTIGVLPDRRGEGLGRELLRWSVAHARAKGAGAVELTVEALNERALGLYRRTGFEPTVEWPHWIIRA